jgi:hypothetical protein
LSQWKQRLGIKFLKAHGEEEDSVDVVKWWKMGVYKAAKFASEILSRWYL